MKCFEKFLINPIFDTVYYVYLLCMSINKLHVYLLDAGRERKFYTVLCF